MTWLIGAGFSRSAGIPLSTEVWQLLAISWLSRWRNRLGEGAAEEALRRLLSSKRGLLPLSLSPAHVDGLSIPQEIGTEAAHLRDDLLRALSELRDRATPVQRTALAISASSRDDAATYRTVFDLAAPTPESRRSFLRTLLSVCCTGPNLAHLLLAALLSEDRGPRTHTVFTVNFDDLLLESLLLLRKGARVFGNPQSADRPLLSPGVTQIVHLHGRQAGYLQQAEGLARDEWFYEHLRESSLLVCGYGGGDEQVMGTVRRWLRGGEMGGYLYWVLHHAAEVELTERRLDGLAVPRERVRLVYRPHQSGALTADDLMMELCAHLMPSVTEFLAELVRHNGHRLQRALLQLCSEYPQRDPVAEQLRALHGAHRQTGKPAPAERQRHLQRAAELAHKGDVPEWRAQVHMAQMREHFLQGQVAEAQVAAEVARAAAEEVRTNNGGDGSGDGDLLRCQTLGLCGELALWQGQLELGRRHLMRLLRDQRGCPPEWREEGRFLLLSALLRACQAVRLRDSGLWTEARALLDMSIDTPVSAVRSLFLEAELYVLQGDLRRAGLVYESADEVARRHVTAMLDGTDGNARRGPGPPAAPADGLAFADPAPSADDSEAILLGAARQARFGLLQCRVATARDAGSLPEGFFSDVEEFTARHPLGDSEGQLMAASLWQLCAASDATRLRRAEEFAEGAVRLLGPEVPPWRHTQVLRTASAVALLAGKFDEAERHARRGQQCARRAEQYDEEARLDLLLSQIQRERGRRGNDDERQRCLRRAVAHAEAAWLRGLELGSTWLTEEADDLLSSLRATPVDIATDVTPVPNPE